MLPPPQKEQTSFLLYPSTPNKHSSSQGPKGKKKSCFPSLHQRIHPISNRSIPSHPILSLLYGMVIEGKENPATHCKRVDGERTHVLYREYKIHPLYLFFFGLSADTTCGSIHHSTRNSKNAIISHLFTIHDMCGHLASVGKKEEKKTLLMKG